MQKFVLRSTAIINDKIQHADKKQMHIWFMAKKPIKKQRSEHTQFPTIGLANLDRAFDNFRRDLERSFASLPSFSVPSFPKMPETSCDIADEGNQFTVKMDVLGVKKNEIDLNVTDNSIQISAQHKEESEKKKKN